MSGGSCAVMVPAVLRADEEWLTGLMEASRTSIDMITIEEGRPPAAVVADHAGINWSPGPGAAGRLAQSGMFDHGVLGVNVPPDSPEWAAFATEFLSSIPARLEADRPQVLIFCGDEDRAALRAKRIPLSEVWWGGIVDRLDTTIAAARGLNVGADPVHISCITEVCGFDLKFASLLVNEWDGCLTSLVDLVSRESNAYAAVAESSTLAARTSATPASSLLDDWNRGLIDAWGRYQPFVAPTALPPETLDQVLRARLWRGQLRELMPLVDEERARLEAWVQSGPIQDGGATFPMEIGPLARLMTQDAEVRPRTSRTRRDAAFWLKNTRNDLAHRNILSPDDISQGLALLDADRREK